MQLPAKYIICQCQLGSVSVESLAQKSPIVEHGCSNTAFTSHQRKAHSIVCWELLNHPLDSTSESEGLPRGRPSKHGFFEFATWTNGHREVFGIEKQRSSSNSSRPCAPICRREIMLHCPGIFRCFSLRSTNCLTHFIKFPKFPDPYCLIGGGEIQVEALSPSIPCSNIPFQDTYPTPSFSEGKSTAGNAVETLLPWDFIGNRSLQSTGILETSLWWRETRIRLAVLASICSIDVAVYTRDKLERSPAISGRVDVMPGRLHGKTVTFEGVNAWLTIQNVFPPTLYSRAKCTLEL